MTTTTTFCRICESLCGLEVTVEDGRVTTVAPDREHVATRGFACVKGIKQARMYDTPDRLTQPLMRKDGALVPVSWDEALADIGRRVKALRADHGADSLAMYVGTAAGFSLLHPIFAQGFMEGLGSSNLYSSATQDCANKFAVSKQIYGFPFTQPFPDLEHTHCLIVVGANPVVSKWSFLQVPNPFLQLHELRKRGAEVIVVDPRRTETARAASEHVFIRPDTDVFFYLGFLHELFARDAVDATRAAHLSGVDTLAELVAPYTPERCAAVTGIDATTLRRLVDTYLQADGAALYSSTGVNMGTDGSLGFWLQECINALSGNLDRAGGTRVGHGIFDFAKFGKRFGVATKEGRSRVGGFSRTNDAFPGGVLADEILTPGPGQVRGLFVTGGNPLITMPNAGRLREALQSLDLLVTVDIYCNETGSLATHVLPATSPFQRPDLPFFFPLWLGMQTRPYLQATRAVVPPQGDQRDEATIYHDLCRACGVGLFGSKAVTAALQTWRRWHRWRHPDAGPGLPQEGILDALQRLAGAPGFHALLDHPHGVLRDDVPPPGDFLGARVQTDDGKVHLAPDALVAALRARVPAAEARERAHRGRLKLITKRALTTHNSWTHNLEDFVPERNRTNKLYMHPDDADARGLADGDVVDVTTATASVRLPVELLDDLMPGVVALPHGWGHQHAIGLSVARRTEGVNVNLLAADGPEALEPVSGMAHLTGFVVDVTPAAGPRDTSSWSGMPPATPRPAGGPPAADPAAPEGR
ncbi:MAG: molybdopterin-dependent oxidoreductase [Alphaproteobacteria bacterium]|nr:molybdopterin-dependent oxidoreductase [Alphaproteobacteria bacterium]